MTDNQTIKNIYSLVQSDIDIYKLFELQKNFTPRELEVHYKIKRAEYEDDEDMLTLIEIAKHVLEDEEMTYTYNHYQQKKVAENSLNLAGEAVLFFLVIIATPFILCYELIRWIMSTVRNFISNLKRFIRKILPAVLVIALFVIFWYNLIYFLNL